MFQIDWSALIDEIVRIGLIFGAIFQVICIAAAIFLPGKSDTMPVANGGNHRKFGGTKNTANEAKPFLEESEPSADEADFVPRRSEANVHNQQLHQRRHLHHSPDDVPQQRTGNSANVTRSSKRHEKKKRR